MADDIDIEEHDVFDNPTIKDMFPDISVLKEEIKRFEEGIQETVNNPDTKYDDEDVIIVENSPPPTGNALVSIVKEDNSSRITASENTFNSNKIILGSKPSKKFEYEEEFFEEQVKSYNVNVVLDDLKPYLNTSGKYCKECMILFPNESALSNHETCVHFANDSKLLQKNNKISANLRLVQKRFKCNQCNILYACQASLQRHNKKTHSRIAQAQQIQKMILKVKSNVNQDQLSPSETICFHCENSFPTQKSLIEHLYSILQSKQHLCEVCSKKFSHSEELHKHMVTHKQCIIALEKLPNQIYNNIADSNENSGTIHPLQTQNGVSETAKINNAVKLNSETEKSNTNVALRSKCYRCYVCSFMFLRIKYYLEHLVYKHNIRTDCNELEKEEFEGKCKYCSRYFNTIYSYNAHLQAVHKEHFCKIIPRKSFNDPKTNPAPSKQDTRYKETKKINLVTQSVYDPKSEPLVLKSTLFKCSKCDIHFLSSKIARNHSEHIEMLINWKCAICKFIFKQDDKILHEEQHKQSEEFTVHDLCPITSSPVLYNCPKCTVHFDEENFIEHYSNCENDTPNSVFCIICDILIDNSISKTHRSDHVSKNLKPTDFIIVNSDILVNNYQKSKKLVNEDKLEDISTVIKKRKDISLNNTNNESSNIPQKKTKHVDRWLNLTYCSMCKCYLTDIDEHQVHFEQHCRRSKTHVCEICGLTLKIKSFRDAHSRIHNLMKNVKLKDFIFYDIKFGKQIVPPIPDYSKCENCNVHFLSISANLNHNCSETDYLTCHICNINLVEDVFSLHMQFHNYSKNNDTITKTQSQQNIETKLTKKNDTKSPKKLKNSGSCLVNNRSTDNTTQPSKKQFRKSQISHHTTTVPKSVKQLSKCGKLRQEIETQSLTNQNISGESVSLQSITENGKILNEVQLDGLLYQCRSCCVSVDTYDKVVEHCHLHNFNEEDILETNKCQICDVTLDRTCYKNHQNMHLIHKKEDFFTNLYFDPFYFTAENKIWVEHVFGTLPQEQRDKIIHNSIYKYECRIKMEVIQNGPADLTVYKCDRCRSFIDGISIYKHAENSCFKLRRHPCSVCGLAYNSSVARIEHEKIHERPNINLMSYRIVTFNKEEDKALNKLLYIRSQVHVLYQCRNCTVAVDKSQTKKHRCSENNLKVCPSCGLLLVNDDYDNHILRHKKLSNFVQKNIKVVLFGETENDKDDSNKIVSLFAGIVYDYTFYSCSNCQVCVKSTTDLEKHSCSFGTNRLKCSICKLYFLTSRLKHHIKLHEIDPDFLRENMRVISFISSNSNPVKDGNVEQHTEPATITAEKKFISRESDNKSKNGEDFESEPKIIMTDGREKNGTKVEYRSAKIYKCHCSLHFIDNLSYVSHFKICDEKTRVAKQNCAKCDLLFTPDILFNHLIIHHGHKNELYKFNVIDMTKNNIIYRCVKCNLHFVNLNDINKHFKTCEVTEGKDCIFCNLKFESSSFLSHDCNNVRNVNADIEVFDLGEPLVPKIEAACESNHQEYLGTKPDLVSETNQEPLKQVEILCENNQEPSVQKTETAYEYSQELSLPKTDGISESNEDLSVPTPVIVCENNQELTQYNIGTITSAPAAPLDQRGVVNIVVPRKNKNKYVPKPPMCRKKAFYSHKSYQRSYNNQVRYNNVPRWQSNPCRWNNRSGPRGQSRPIRPGSYSYNESWPMMTDGFSSQQPSSFGPQQPLLFRAQQPQSFNSQQSQSFGSQQVPSFSPQQLQSFGSQQPRSFSSQCHPSFGRY